MRKSARHRARVVDYVRRRGRCTRSAISTDLGMAQSVASGVVRELLGSGILVAGDLEASGGGRPRRQVCINPDYGAAIGIHVAMRGIRGGMVDLAGRIVTGHEEPGCGSGRVSESLDAIARTIRVLSEECGSRRLCGIGIGVSGVIREGGRVCRDFPSGERWADVPLAEIVAEQCGVRPRLVNDVQAAALGELRLGGWGEVRNLLLLHMGDGIAAGVVTDGRLYQGGTLNAGQVGHIVIREDGPLCYCGNRGCLESLASSRAVVASYGEAVAAGVNTAIPGEAGSGGEVGFEHIVAAAEKGDRLAHNLLSEAGAHIGGVAGNLISIFDPELVILGGLLSRSRNELVAQIERTALSRVLPILRNATRIELSRLGGSASVLGVAMLVTDEVFGDAEALLSGGFIAEG